MATILIIEDESELARLLRSYLEKDGFRVRTAGRGDTGLAAFEQETPDLVLLDLNLPGIDGVDVARAIRRHGETPIIMVTARVGEEDRLNGLDLADDYVIKPYSPREVVARVKAVLRRAGAKVPVMEMIRADDLEINLSEYTVARAGMAIELTRTEFDLLAALAAQPGRVLSRQQLTEAVRGEMLEGFDRAIDAHIKNLRSKLEPEPKNPFYIETVFGVGYRFRRPTRTED